MVKEPVNRENMKVNVFLKDGTELLGKDVTPQPMGEHERVVSFWDGDVIKVYPFDLVERLEYTFDA